MWQNEPTPWSEELARLRAVLSTPRAFEEYAAQEYGIIKPSLVTGGRLPAGAVGTSVFDTYQGQLRQLRDRLQRHLQSLNVIDQLARGIRMVEASKGDLPSLKAFHALVGSLPFSHPMFLKDIDKLIYALSTKGRIDPTDILLPVWLYQTLTGPGDIRTRALSLYAYLERMFGEGAGPGTPARYL